MELRWSAIVSLFVEASNILTLTLAFINNIYRIFANFEKPKILNLWPEASSTIGFSDSKILGSEVASLITSICTCWRLRRHSRILQESL